MADPGPGRSCPASYRYGAAALAGPAQLEADTLWVAGGLYGNRFALERLCERYEAEPGAKALVFNGDFHWFDADEGEFRAVSEGVRRHRATLGNVELELADPQPGAGCGCAYPGWVDEGAVARSNRILERLRSAAPAPEVNSLKGLAKFLVASVGGERVAIVHGDADSLAGWGFSQECLATPEGLAAARAAFGAAKARVFASSHSCLPVLQSFDGARVLANNGSAGMPNFRGARYGLATRISVRPRAGAVHAARAGALHVEAQPIAYDHEAWLARFLELWPRGSDAFESYHGRIVHGPAYERPCARRAA
jgi:hypothetical protein